MKYKVGDKVKVHSLHWFYENGIKIKDEDESYYISDIHGMRYYFSIPCNINNIFEKVVTITNIDSNNYYLVAEDNLCYAEWLFEKRIKKADKNYKQDIMYACLERTLHGMDSINSIDKLVDKYKQIHADIEETLKKARGEKWEN